MNEPQRTRAYCGAISGYSCLGPVVRSYRDVPTARLRRKDRRIYAHLGVLPDDLYIQSEPWPRIGRPLKHGATLENLQIVRRVAPISGEHLV
jgi:hypothetical protein